MWARDPAFSLGAFLPGGANASLGAHCETYRGRENRTSFPTPQLYRLEMALEQRVKKVSQMSIQLLAFVL